MFVEWLVHRAWERGLHSRSLRHRCQLATSTRKKMHYGFFETFSCEQSSIITFFPGWAAPKCILQIPKSVYLSTRIICQRQAAKSDSSGPANWKWSLLPVVSQPALLFASWHLLKYHSFVHSVFHSEICLQCLLCGRHRSRVWRCRSGKFSTHRNYILVKSR